jgi:hypothetical protein
MAVLRPESVRPRAHIGLSDIPSAIRKLTRRLEDLEKLASAGRDTDLFGIAKVISTKINETVEDVFGDDTQEAKRFSVRLSSFLIGGHPEIEGFHKGRTRAIGLIRTAIEGLQEKLADAEEDAAGKTLRAYKDSTSIQKLSAPRASSTRMVTTPPPSSTQ